MNLYDELESIKNLSNETKLRVVCNDKTVIEGKYRGYTSALNNEPEIAQIDIYSEKGNTLYGLLETEVISVEEIS